MKFYTANKGFTLIELLVVVAVIGILSSVVLSSVNNTRTKARDATRKMMVKQVINALEQYANDNGNYPVVTDGNAFNTIDVTLSALVPNYISSLEYDTTNAAVGAHYHRPTASTDGYVLWYTLEKQTQASPISYMCKTGIGAMVANSYLYPNTPVCN